ncbi:MAG: transglutaminase family protein [Rhodospirillales bacterium]
MTIHVALNHTTSYRYDRPIALGPQVVRLRPAPHSRTAIVSYSLTVAPKRYFLNWQQDPHGNYLARLVFPEKEDHFTIAVDLVADMAVHNPFDFFLEPEAKAVPFSYDALTARDLEPYLATEAAGPLLQAWLAEVSAKPSDTVDYLVALNQRLQQDIGYVVRMEPGVQTPEETLRLAKGSCRDSGWLLVQILRHLGIAARFVSGYLIQLTADVKALDGPAGAAEDFTDLHAWAEAYLPGAGWIGLDPTSGLLAGEGHIPLAATPHPASAAPISGAVEAAETTFDFTMSVDRILETPRVTKPYSEAQWRAIDASGAALDKELTAQDVRLTIGGEPTFVSIDDPEGAEWNTDATGPTKRRLAHDQIKRLKARFGPGGLLQHGTGKWYPGEPLPRWAFGLYWRRDGVALLSRPDIIAEEDKDYAPDAATAQSLAAGVARRLGIDADSVQPAFEDPGHFLEQEERLPENVQVEDNKLDDRLAGRRLARAFRRGLDEPVCFVLPLQAADEGQQWRSELWRMRGGRLLLIPGDSAAGLRLPLASLPKLKPEDYPHIIPRDPFEPRGALPEGYPQRQPFLSKAKGGGPTQGVEAAAEDKAKPVRTAMTVEPRDGRLCVFMPPTERLEHYLDLLAAVEDSAAELGLALHIEGYPPPDDPRLQVIKVTPDPGVIEVNIQPAESWAEMTAITEGIYEEAFKGRLGTEKFMVDGRHTGTGGGNHLVLGAAKPEDSPFLRRPDLLQSLVTYWQHHPALSYLFSGLFIGPTSQAPRIDEARNDQLYELDLAFTQVPDPAKGETLAPWLVDRIFRNLLIDVTGNTHRTEICIDKLYSPDGPTGRLGLVEFRAFEMPPHARMSLVQQLLLRALISRFWKTPYRGKLIRWGTALHDRFLLPHYVWQDLRAVVAEMQEAGYAFEADWFAPHREFRFPRYGSFRHQAVEVEIRQALEPWHVMGEEGNVGGTVRYVDSSLERLQIKASGLSGDRYIVACNGKQVPLQATEVAGEAVAGVRFRAWQPASALHPTIPVDAPLVFDLYDRWSGRAVAGCTYHVAHPGGIAYETFPVNGYEAESRRLARFVPFGHRPGRQPEPESLSQPEMPHTLDLRWSRKDPSESRAGELANDAALHEKTSL